MKEAFAEEHFDVTDAEGRAVKVEARIYDEGFAFRCRLSEGGAFEERTSVDYPADARAWAIEETEGTYPPEPLRPPPACRPSSTPARWGIRASWPFRARAASR